MKEELKKEAERYIIGQRQHYTMDFDEVHRLVVGFADYVTKELQEEIDKQENYRLAQDSKISFLITDNEQLKKQIEKMKMCLNCKKFGSVNRGADNRYCYLHDEIDVCSDWEFKE